MVSFSETHYSHDECISAVRDYYTFLTKMYLDEDLVLEPPEGGWPNITAQNLQGCDKTDEVIALLRHLPYIDDTIEAHAVPRCFFTNWQSLVQGGPNAIENNESLKSVTEDFEKNVPSRVVGLTDGPDNHELFFLLDTKLGIIHWLHCAHKWRYNQVRERIEGNPADYGLEDEEEWRGDAPAWSVADFFEVLKDKFRSLDFVPLSNRKVIFAESRNTESQGVVPMVQNIYRAHGWPDLGQYRKHDCLLAIRTAMEARYPDVSLNP